MNIAEKTLPKNQYFQEETQKKIIVLHHTMSGAGVENDIAWWDSNSERVGTHYIIDRNGEVTRVVEDKYWIHHLGIKQSMLNQMGSNVTNTRLNQLSIGIEIDSWGGLVKNKEGKWITWTGKEVAPENVALYPNGYRGYYGYEKYTEEQINSVKELIIYLSEKHQIPKKYFPEMFDFNAKALKGYHGIWTHTSYRPDKSDCHPQPELIAMLKGL